MADCVDVCSVNSCPSVKPNNTIREFTVRSNVRLTMPFGANWVSSASDRIFSCAASNKGFSLMRQISHGHALWELTQVKFSTDNLMINSPCESRSSSAAAIIHCVHPVCTRASGCSAQHRAGDRNIFAIAVTQLLMLRCPAARAQPGAFCQERSCSLRAGEESTPAPSEQNAKNEHK